MTSKTAGQTRGQSGASFLPRTQTVEEVERGMIRVVNLGLMGVFSSGIRVRIVVFVVYVRFLLVASGCMGGYGGL